jgi:protein gp37/ParB-like chromosome segregation protein Spo0J
MTDYQQHPLSAAFPAMTDAAFAELRADIVANGLRSPITLFDEQVLDGWSRYRACSQAGVEPRFETFGGDEAAARKFVVSANLIRRHLDTSERAIVAARFATMPAHRPGKGANSPTSIQQAADLFNVSTRSVKDARAVLTSGDDEVIGQVGDGKISVSHAAKTVRANKPKPAPTKKAQPKAKAKPVNIEPQTVEQWANLSASLQRAHLKHRNPEAKLNQQKSGEDDNLIDWAKWTWNPITGCLHNCPYCYARDIAERFAGTSPFPNGFTPTLRADRLSAPLNFLPRESEDQRERRIFTGSMTDLFGRWVPAEWIEAVLRVADEAKLWEFLMLTKFPKRMAEFEIPANVWMGTTVDCQVRVTAAEEAFARVTAKVKWLSCEPLIEPLRFRHLDRFDMIVIGGASPSSETPKWIPPFSWLDDLMRQADDAGCAVFLKSNMYRKEQPGGPRYRFLDKAPKVFHYLTRSGDRRDAANELAVAGAA